LGFLGRSPFGLLIDPCGMVRNQEALELVAEAGAHVDRERQIAHIPGRIAR
jgi:hypothetical protein